MKKFAIAMLLAGSTLLMADGAAAFGSCAGCHGTKGEKVAMGKSAVIGGQDAAKTLEQLKGYKAGTLDTHGMGGLMKTKVAALDDATLKELADYIATLNK